MNEFGDRKLRRTFAGQPLHPPTLPTWQLLVISFRVMIDLFLLLVPYVLAVGCRLPHDTCRRPVISTLLTGKKVYTVHPLRLSFFA
jgi:hypothetical protein